MIIDTHCHFDMMSNPERYIQEKEQSGEIVIGMTNLPSHFAMGSFKVRPYKHIRLALGLHPLLVEENANEVNLFKKYIDSTSYIGEIGLDFSREGNNSKDLQVYVFKEILSALNGKNKVVSVHSRRAERELFNLLIEYDIKNVIFHWYTGPLDLMPLILERGYYFSINESMCNSKRGQSVISRIPIDRIVTETDAPFNQTCDIRKMLSMLNISEDLIEGNFRRILQGIRK